jgi:tRNA-modifying protein YgfZ
MPSAQNEPIATPAVRDLETATYCAEPEFGLLSFTGPDAESFLQGQLSSDVKALAPGAVQWSSYNSPKGRMLATLLLWRNGHDAICALVPVALAEPLRKRLSMYVLRSKLAVADLSSTHVMLGVGGARGSDAVAAACGRAPARGHVLVSETESLVGFPDGRIVVITAKASGDAMAARLAGHAAAIGSETWRWLGIRAGVPTIHAATQDQFVLQTTNWDVLGGVSFQKGCYPGQEIVARTQYLGRLKERMHLFHLDGPPPAVGTRLYAPIFEDQACGTVVDAASAPEGGADLLAVVQLSVLDEALRLGTPGGPMLTMLPLPYSVPAPVAPNRSKL